MISKAKGGGGGVQQFLCWYITETLHRQRSLLAIMRIAWSGSVAFNGWPALVSAPKAVPIPLSRSRGGGGGDIVDRLYWTPGMHSGRQTGCKECVVCLWCHLRAGQIASSVHRERRMDFGSGPEVLVGNALKL